MESERLDCEPRLYFSLRRNNWVLDDDICRDSNGIRVCVDRGYITDLASTPFFIRPIINTYGRYNSAAVAHDKLYQSKGVVGNTKLTRKECDDIFRDIMLQDGVSPLLAGVMWASVRYWPLNHPLFKKW